MRSGTLIGPIIIAIGLIIAAVSFAVVGALLDTADARSDIRLGRLEAEIADLRGDLADARATVRRLEIDVEVLEASLAEALARRAPAAPAPTAPSAPIAPVQPDAFVPFEEAETIEVTEPLEIDEGLFNIGISQPNNFVMLDVLGTPRDSFSQACQPVTNPRIAGLLETRDLGPFRVTMIRPALDSLERIIARLEIEEPDLYEALGTAGALCARNIRGSSTGISNHSWGTAIDIRLAGILDGFGDGDTQAGLVPLALVFNDEGWYWGAVWRREDSMHFEVGVETLRAWEAQGLLEP
ncbi:MAG: M15 family metallopeptidase [Pseudomonadota bacterium]